ncbi:MAG: CBS domain-containing protein [Candidatus Bathyarchaeota archaeon]|nr:CBS domain-containing protein [Candidatus Bathyarchaeota archaeon]
MPLKVKDVMVENVISVPERATVKEAAELMEQREIGCLIVVRKGKPVGIVTETDMVKRVILGPVDPENTRVRKIMSRPLVVVHTHNSLEEASKIMRERKIRKLPVIEKGRLVGLITTTDIVRSPEVMKMMIRSVKRNVFKEIVRSIEEKIELEK